MSPADNALQQALNDYRSRLPERAQQLAALAADSGALEALLQQLHRLAGSAGMYELTQLGQQAKSTHRAYKLGEAGAQHELARLLAMMKSAA